jgi:hypothetical protein
MIPVQDVHMLGLHVKRPVFKAVNALVARRHWQRDFEFGIFLVMLGDFMRDCLE